MRIPLTPTPAFLTQLADPPSASSPSDPPLIWIDSQPFLLELQGILEPPADEKGAGEAGEAAGTSMEGVRVGKVDLADPKKPVLRIAHHRLEGKVEKLLTPYTLLRTTRSSSSPFAHNDDATDSRSTKRRKLSPSTSFPSQPSSSSPSDSQPQISLAALITHKLVFSRRPEPLIDVSSEADPGFGGRKREALESWGKRGAGGAGVKRSGGGGGMGGFFGKAPAGAKG